jgi:ribosomal protein L37AE/L43A
MQTHAEYSDTPSRIEKICPYCRSTIFVSYRAREWVCRYCGNSFNISIKDLLLHDIKMLIKGKNAR